MADKNTIKNWFKTGLKPTQAQFWATWDSFWHKDEKIPITAIDDIEAILAEKADAEVLAHHLNDATAHADLFLGKEDKFKKGVASGYVPLNEFVKIASEYLNIVNDLFTGGATAILSAEQGVVLQTQIENINALLASDNVNLDNVQELVDAIETVQMSLGSILVNDLTTGGTTKAATAETVKVLKGLIDNLVIPMPAIIAIDEGKGIGYVIASRNPLNYGNVGLRAVDLSISNGPSTTKGATGEGSFASGSGSIASGINSTASGSGCEAGGNFSTASGLASTASGSSSTANGQGCLASGDFSTAKGGYSTANGNCSTAIGLLVIAKSYSEAVFGMFNTIYTPNSATVFNLLDRIFVIGNGKDNLTHSDAFIVLKNGLTTLPSVTNALITAEPTGKAVVTKEWAEARFKTQSITSGTEVSTTSITDVVVNEMTITPPLAGTYKLDFNGRYNFMKGNVVTQATLDLQALTLNLQNRASTGSHSMNFVNGEIITPGVYDVNGAAALSGTITLDAQNNSNAVFIFRVVGAINSTAGTTFALSNGAKAENIFWTSTGAIGLTGNNVALGNFISLGAAVELGASSMLSGRFLSTGGAITISSSVQSKPTGASFLPLGILENFVIFSVAGNVNNAALTTVTGNVGTGAGIINYFAGTVHLGNDYSDGQQMGITNVFSIYSNGVIVPFSSRNRYAENFLEEIILTAVFTTTVANQPIDIRWRTDVGIVFLKNRILTITKI